MVDGDPRVVYPLAAVLSAIYAAIAVYGASLLDYVSFSLGTVAAATVIVFAATYAAILR
ncbi:hypothetical protein J2752_001895 [Halarchaeum rubridurum]|uniref:DUF8107 domain-containing protein n=1 Tax=Halarchaeum rubridurum TaxID=489911 RepID=A0A830G0W1_9EURY|nr:hypothetical protein [Halarchaeum rubridurum]MBP1954983.1 hypothetical protein [Halarchaeum rubridurum]GGM69939.1 hypothetical protein GCM10009017_20090 [Halarchaeum rubridurum]